MGKADRYQKLYPVTWDQLHRDAKALAWRLLEQGPFKGIIGVARGGLVPAAIVARELNIRLVDTLCICTYQGREQTGGEEVLKAIEGDGDGWLVVDDLVDTGNTATIIRNMLPKAPFRHPVLQARRKAPRGHLHHRSQPRYVDSFPVGLRSAVYRPAGGTELGVKTGSPRQTAL